MKKNDNNGDPNNPHNNGVRENFTEGPTQKMELAAEYQASIYTQEMETRQRLHETEGIWCSGAMIL